MTKVEIQVIKNALHAVLAELAQHGHKPPLPYIHEDNAVWMLRETRDGHQYRILVCEL